MNSLENNHYKFWSDPDNEKGCCRTCPNSQNEDSEYAQNTGCLPNAFDIIKGVDNGDIWECHDRKGRVCGCAKNYANVSGAEIGNKPTTGLGFGTLNGEQY